MFYDNCKGFGSIERPSFESRFWHLQDMGPWVSYFPSPSLCLFLYMYVCQHLGEINNIVAVKVPATWAKRHCFSLSLFFLASWGLEPSIVFPIFHQRIFIEFSKILLNEKNLFSVNTKDIKMSLSCLCDLLLFGGSWLFTVDNFCLIAYVSLLLHTSTIW